jgi:hypothetical protein
VVIMLAGAAGIWLSYKITNDRRRVPTDAIDPAVEEQYRTIEASHAHDQHHTRVEHVTDGRTAKPAVTKPAKPVAPKTQTTQPIPPQPVESELGQRFGPVQAVDKPRTAPPVDGPPVTGRPVTEQPPATGQPSATGQPPVAEPPPSTERTVELDPSASGLPEQPRRRTN